MTDTAATPGRASRALRGIADSRIALWAGFAGAHVIVAVLGLTGPNQPFGDVTLVYRWWFEQGIESGTWVGIDRPSVYPIVAIVPMILAGILGSGPFLIVWLLLVTLLDAAAFAVVIRLARARGSVAPAWWWTAFLLALGPIALGRIDSVTVPLALVGMLLLARNPVAATVLVTLAAWIKVWPAALVAAAVVALRSRPVVLAAAAVTSAAVAAVALLLGAGTNLVSFLGQQTSRGLQIEAVIATPWMWDATAHRPGGSAIVYDTDILTFQLVGPGADAVAAIATPLMVLAAAALLLVGVRVIRVRPAVRDLLPPLALALTVALIVFNKVGSPQFATWLAVPIVLGLVTLGRAFRVPAVLSLVLAGFTQAFYPFLYDRLLGAEPLVVALLTVRNALYVALLVWATVAVGRLARRPVTEEHLEV